MFLELHEVTFTAKDRRLSLLAARRFVSGLVGPVSIVKGENVRLDGAIYVVVEGTEENIHVALMGKEVEGVTVAVSPTVASEGVECVNCGNKADQAFVRCPACEFDEIAGCPFCGAESPRSAYLSAEGELHCCPACGNRVRLSYADPMWNEDGYYNQPLINVERA